MFPDKTAPNGSQNKAKRLNNAPKYERQVLALAVTLVIFAAEKIAIAAIKVPKGIPPGNIKSRTFSQPISKGTVHTITVMVQTIKEKLGCLSIHIAPLNKKEQRIWLLIPNLICSLFCLLGSKNAIILYGIHTAALQNNLAD